MTALPPPPEGDRVVLPPPRPEERVELTRKALWVTPWVVAFLSLIVLGIQTLL